MYQAPCPDHDLIQESNETFKAKVDALDSCIQAVEADLNSRIEALVSIRLQVVEDITATTEAASLSTSILEILVDLPKNMRGAI